VTVGVWQLVLILLLVLVLFGAGKLPQVVSDMCKALKDIRKSVNDDGSSS
jgi:sec-independent protein translocase protein TatA